MIRCLHTFFTLSAIAFGAMGFGVIDAKAQIPTSALPDTVFKQGQAQIIFPGRLCPGSDFLVKLESFNIDTAEFEVTLRASTTPPFSKQSIRTTNGKAELWLSTPPATSGYQLVPIQIVIRDFSQTQAVPVDTHSGGVIVMDKCCDNTAMNGTFLVSNSSSGPCFPVDYATDMEFTLDVPCLGAITKIGQVASGYTAVFGRPDWESPSRTNGSHMLYGDPLPNTKRKAWWQTEPVYGGRAFVATAWVRNVEKTPRAPNPLTNLRMMLVATQGPRIDTLATQEFLQYNANRDSAWKQLSSTYVPVDDGDMELSVVVECITPEAIGNGFAIDDISFVPVRTQVNAGAGGKICGGQGGAQLNPVVPPGFTAFWRPANGMTDTLSLTPVVSPSVTTTYILIVRDTFNCVDSGAVTITVLPADSMSITAVDSVLCGGDSVVLRAEAGLTSYQWFMNSALISGATSDTLLVTVPAVYRLQSLSPSGCPLVSNTIVVYQQQPATVSAVVDTSNLELPLRVGSVVDIPIIVTRALPPFSPQLPIVTNVIIEVPPSVLYPQSGFASQGIGFDSQGPGVTRLVTATTSAFIEIDTVVVRWLVTLGNDSVVTMRARTQTPAGDCATDDSSNIRLMSVDICRAGGDRLIYAGSPSTPFTIAPQPSDDIVIVQAYILERGRTYLDVVSATGVVLYQMSTEADTDGLHTFTLPTSNLPSGAYQLLLRGPNTTAVTMLRVVH